MSFGPGMLTTKLILEAYLNLSPDRSEVPKLKICWAPRSVYKLELNTVSVSQACS